MKALIYTRVATKRQAERSGPSRQEEVCRTYCEQKGWEVIGVWHEVSRSDESWMNRSILYDLVTIVLPEQQPAVLVAEDIGCFTQLGYDDLTTLEAAVERRGGRLASPQLENPIVQRMMSELYSLFLETQRQVVERDDDPD